MKSKAKILLALLLPAVVFVVGCAPAAPPPEAVLAGNWKLTTVNPSNLPDTTLQFDANGELTNIVYIVNGTTINQAPIGGSTTVSGQSVVISQSLENGSSLNFNGTLNSANTQAQGSLVATLNIGVLNIVFNGVPATLTKQ